MKKQGSYKFISQIIITEIEILIYIIFLLNFFLHLLTLTISRGILNWHMVNG